MADQKPKCVSLVLDAGPLLSLSPLRGLAQTYFTTPQVLSELKDKRAREHFERLGLNAGVKVEIQNPDALSLAAVVKFAKKTGDYAVLSHADLCVLALTYSLHEKAKAQEERLKSQGENVEEATLSPDSTDPTTAVKEDVPESKEEVDLEPLENATPERDSTDVVNEDVPEGEEEADLEPLDVEIQPISSEIDDSTALDDTKQSEEEAPLFEDPSDSDDGEGEWITPTNVSLHKSRALDLLPTAGSKGKNKTDPIILAGCMTADFAMQNVLLQMGLSLVGVEGKRIERVKSWVLRCHACFKICKDSSKKFCPSCGNATLLRASVTIVAPNASSSSAMTTIEPTMKVHLKPNFQYKTRGTIYSIPAPKPGSAKKGPGEGLILREDQAQYLRAKKLVDGRREREEERMTKGIISTSASKGGDGVNGLGSWNDPDFIPEMLRVGAGGKGRQGPNGDMPVIGYGRKNPNERRRKR